jgi:ABC-type polysaccharide/polyol phosphate export permease
LSKWIRQIHRWLAIAFTLTVVMNIVALSVSEKQPADWITYSPLLPLALLLLTGLYLFVLPYAVRRRASHSAVDSP